MTHFCHSVQVLEHLGTEEFSGVVLMDLMVEESHLTIGIPLASVPLRSFVEDFLDR